MMAAIQAGAPKGITVTKQHHDPVQDVRRAATDGGYEVWAVIREPLSQLKSWISHAQSWGDVDKFIETYSSRYFFYDEGMNIYNRVTNRHFVYENDGINTLIQELELPNTYTPTVVGATNSQEHELCKHQVKAAKKRFAFDFALYSRVVGA